MSGGGGERGGVRGGGGHRSGKGWFIVTIAFQQRPKGKGLQLKYQMDCD